MKSLFLSLAAILLTLAPNSFADDQDYLHDTITVLNRAKFSHSLEDLHEAQRRLQHMIKRGGEKPRRKDALKDVNGAIAAMKAAKDLEPGKVAEADKRIDSALKNLKDAAAAR